jgi:hypothetical protein
MGYSMQYPWYMHADRYKSKQRSEKMKLLKHGYIWGIADTRHFHNEIKIKTTKKWEKEKRIN